MQANKAAPIETAGLPIAAACVRFCADSDLKKTMPDNGETGPLEALGGARHQHDTGRRLGKETRQIVGYAGVFNSNVVPLLQAVREQARMNQPSGMRDDLYQPDVGPELASSGRGLLMILATRIACR